MSIVNFIKNLLPRLQKSEIEEDLRITLKELSTIAIPMYYTASQTLRLNKVNSEDAKLFEKAFYNTVNLKKKGPNFISDIHACLERMLANLTYLQDVVNNVLEADIIKEGLTAKKAHVVRAVGAISEASFFSIDFLNHILILETNSLSDADSQTQEPPAQLKYINKKYLSFFKTLSDFGMDPANFKQIFQDIPDVVLTTKNSESVLQVFKPAKIDPFPMIAPKGFIGNPIYHARLIWSTFAANRYHADKDKKMLLELRLLNLNTVYEKNPNPRLQKEIEYLEGRIAGIDKKIREFENSINGGDL